MNLIRLQAISLGMLLALGACSANEQGQGNEFERIDGLLAKNLLPELTRFVAVPTFRDTTVSEADVVRNLGTLQGFLKADAEEFNGSQRVSKLLPFEWKAAVPGENRDHWVFGYRLGSGSHKLTLVCHLDTVPPGANTAWKPFELQLEQRAYQDDPDAEFYVGRGTIDDKGPAIVIFNVLKALAQTYDGSPLLDDSTIEVAFDTSEETDLSYAHYIAAEPQEAADFGIIHDAFWTVRAEKGIERPTFYVEPGAAVTDGVWIERLDTPAGPANQVADTATAVLRSNSPEQLAALATEIESLYAAYGFDDPDYHRAELTVDANSEPNGLVLVTKVAGAQHGSAPDENRSGGANPLVSLADFLAGLVDQGRLANNPVARLAQFIAWGWGTKVFGEHFPDLLERHDEVFGEGNGTSYAITRFDTNPDDATGASVKVDIRYAIGHHSQPWDGKTEGLLPGKDSIFGERVFPALIEQFNATTGAPVKFKTSTAFAPDIRLPDGANFSRVQAACSEALGSPCPALAIGGGTDAKGQTTLVAAGALFTNRLGPPINFHGFNEGAPVEDLKRSGRVLYRLLRDEVETTY